MISYMIWHDVIYDMIWCDMRWQEIRRLSACYECVADVISWQNVDRFMRRWKRGFNTCSRTDLEFIPVVVARQRDDRLVSTTATVKCCQTSIMSTTATVKSCQSSIMSTGGRPAVSSSVSSLSSAVRDSRRLDLAKPHTADLMEVTHSIMFTCWSSSNAAAVLLNYVCHINCIGHQRLSLSSMLWPSITSTSGLPGFILAPTTAQCLIQFNHKSI